MAGLLFLGRRIELANRDERKSPACETVADFVSAFCEVGGTQKTRPSTQYTVNDLASPGY